MSIESLRKACRLPALDAPEPVQKPGSVPRVDVAATVRKSLGLPEPEITKPVLKLVKPNTAAQIAKSERELEAQAEKITALRDAKLALLRVRTAARAEVLAKFTANVEEYIAKSGDTLLEDRLKLAKLAETLLREGGVRVEINQTYDALGRNAGGNVATNADNATIRVKEDDTAPSVEEETAALIDLFSPQ